MLAGCGSDEIVTTPLPSTVPERPPSAAALATIRSSPGAPIYWLGTRYGDDRLTRARLTAQDPPDAIFQYGEPACESGAGCTYPVGVATARKRNPASEEACWRELGAALVLACPASESLQIYTGDVEVFIRSADGRPLRAARALRLKSADAGATAVASLPAPRPFSCEQVERFPDAFAAVLPAALRPRCG
ncbi:MAG: hypothetical protein ACRDKY_04355 [Solirubrobacteraceae bacterium]